MPVKYEKRFRYCNKYCICPKLFTGEDKNVRDHDYITVK